MARQAAPSINFFHITISPPRRLALSYNYKSVAASETLSSQSIPRALSPMHHHVARHSKSSCILRCQLESLPCAAVAEIENSANNNPSFIVHIFLQLQRLFEKSVW
jgi:hypothetical protein